MSANWHLPPFSVYEHDPPRRERDSTDFARAPLIPAPPDPENPPLEAYRDEPAASGLKRATARDR